MSAVQFWGYVAYAVRLAFLAIAKIVDIFSIFVSFIKTLTNNNSCNGVDMVYEHNTGWSKKTVPQFYFCDNFRKCTPILTIFSPLEPDIYDA